MAAHRRRRAAATATVAPEGCPGGMKRPPSCRWSSAKRSSGTPSSTGLRDPLPADRRPAQWRARRGGGALPVRSTSGQGSRQMVRRSGIRRAGRRAGARRPQECTRATAPAAERRLSFAERFGRDHDDRRVPGGHRRGRLRAHHAGAYRTHQGGRLRSIWRRRSSTCGHGGSGSPSTTRGAGYSGLSHILDLKPDVIKLDINLTRGIDKDPARRALGRALLSFGLDAYNATLVAEGIETKGEFETLRSLGCPNGQGFLLGRPALLEAPSRVRKPSPLPLIQLPGPPHSYRRSEVQAASEPCGTDARLPCRHCRSISTRSPASSSPSEPLGSTRSLSLHELG